MTVGGRFEAFLTVPSGVSLSANTGGGATAVSLTAGNYTPTQLCAHVQARLIAVMTGAWTVTVSTGRTGTGLVTIALGSSFSITWTSTDLRDALGFTGSLSSVTTVTGTVTAKGLWLPDCPLVMSHDPSRAPEVTDTSSTRGPTGRVIGYSSNLFYRHKTLSYSHVQQARVYEGAAVNAGLPVGASWQQWLRDTQWGRGHAWFSPCSAFQFYWDNAGTETIVGIDLNSGAGPAYGWAFDPALPDLDHVSLAASPWLGLLQLNLGTVVSQG